MARRAYSSGKPDALPDPIEFELDGTVYVCRELGPLDLSEIAKLQGTDAESPAALAFMSEFFEMLLGRDQYKGFRAAVGKFETRIETLVEIIQGVFEDFAQRPTLPPSDSSVGQPITKRNYPGVSSSRVMARYAGRPDIQAAIIHASDSR